MKRYNSKTKIAILLLLVYMSIGIASAIPVEEWNKTFSCGAGCNNTAQSVQQTIDGGYIIVGDEQYAFDGFFPTAARSWLIKTNSAGNIQMNKKFADMITYSAKQTRDGNYIMAGNKDNDVFLIKINTNGGIIWNKTFNYEGDQYLPTSIQQTVDGGYIIAGWKLHFYPEVEFTYAKDGFIIKTDSSGNEEWHKIFYGGYIHFWSIQQTSDRGYVIVGNKEYGQGLFIKTDYNGNQQWSKTFEGIILSIQQTSDTGYILAGFSNNNALLIKTDSNGNKNWNKTYGGSDYDIANSVQQTKDGNYIVAGFTKSFGAGNGDAWLFKTDTNGNKLWQKTFGGNREDSAHFVRQTIDGGYIIAGYKASNAWLIKLKEVGIIVTSPNGGEKWAIGTTKQIKWNYTANTGANVKIELLKSGVLNNVINSSTPNDGVYDWRISSIQTLGSDYKIRITSTTNSLYTDNSNNNFTVSNPYITVVSPNGGENWIRGTTHTISWEKDGNVGSYVKIQLYKSGILKSTISSSTLNDGFYSWTIPLSLTSGSDYKIKITSTSNSIYYDWSNNYFRIS